MKKNIILAVILFAIMIVLILGSQSPDLSNGITVNFARLLKFFFEKLPGGDRSINEIDGYIRKIAHFAEYLLLSTVIYMTVVQYVKKNLWCVLITFVIVGLIAFVDEAFVQRLLSGGRTVSIYDIVFDMLGCVISIVNIKIIEFYQLIFNKYKNLV